MSADEVGELSSDDIKTLLQRLRTEIEELRAENERLREENRILRDRLESLESKGRSDGSESEHDRLRKKAEAQRIAKRRRDAARAATRSTVCKRGKRSPRPPFVPDDTIVCDVPVGDLPTNAVPNGYIDRPFYGVSITRCNVLIRRREYISPTQGWTAAKIPAGWSGEFTPDTWVTINTLSMGGMTESKIKELFADHGVKISA